MDKCDLVLSRTLAIGIWRISLAFLSNTEHTYTLLFTITFFCFVYRKSDWFFLFLFTFRIWIIYFIDWFAKNWFVFCSQNLPLKIVSNCQRKSASEKPLAFGFAVIFFCSTRMGRNLPRRHHCGDRKWRESNKISKQQLSDRKMRNSTQQRFCSSTIYRNKLMIERWKLTGRSKFIAKFALLFPPFIRMPKKETPNEEETSKKILHSEISNQYQELVQTKFGFPSKQPQTISNPHWSGLESVRPNFPTIRLAVKISNLHSSLHSHLHTRDWIGWF